MKKRDLTPFGLCVKTELLRRGMEQQELIKMVKTDTGLYLDTGYMYKILTGQRNSPAVTASIRKILNIPAH